MEPRVRRWIVIGIGYLLAATAAAQPQAPATTADSDAAQAQVRAQQGDRQGAIDFYERAYAASLEPSYLLAIAQLYEALADQGDSRSARLAITYYQQYLQQKAPVDRQEIESHIDRLFRGLQGGVRDPNLAPGFPVPQPPVATGAPPALAGAPAPVGQTVPIQFVAQRRKDDYWVAAGGQKCHAPCTLQLVPGPETISAAGSGQITASILVPPQPGTVRLHHNRPRLVAGIVLLTTGAAIASSLWAAGLGCYGYGGNDSCLIANFAVWPIVGGSMFFTGIGLIASARSSQPHRVELRTANSSGQLRLSSFGIVPTRFGAMAGMGWTF
jgi:hypothetical protein